MKWLAILLSLASLGGTPAPGRDRAKRHCAGAAKHCRTAKPKQPTKQPPATQKPAAGRPATPGAPAPGAPEPEATPTATATPEPTLTPTPTPSYPRRTAVDLVEWDIRSSYLTLGAGRVTFNANNRGQDDHNLSVRGGGHEYGRVDLAPRESAPLALDLAPGSYTLYCSLLGHEDAGMRLDVTVK